MTRRRVSPVEADLHRGKRAWGGRGVGVAIGMVARNETRRLEGRADGRTGAWERWCSRSAASGMRRRLMQRQRAYA
jgi:hypothetical protein